MHDDTLIVFFPDRPSAVDAIDALIDTDFPSENISMLTLDSATAIDTLPALEQDDPDTMPLKAIESVTSLDNKTGRINFLDVGDVLIMGVLADTIERALEFGELVDTGIGSRDDLLKILRSLGIPRREGEGCIERLQAGETFVAIPAAGEAEELTDFLMKQHKGQVIGVFNSSLNVE